jgi:hypothetical protein
VADGVDAGVQAVQSPVPHAAADAGLGEAAGTEVGQAEDPEAPGGQARDLHVGPSVVGASGGDAQATLGGSGGWHAPTVAPVV